MRTPAPMPLFDEYDFERKLKAVATRGFSLRYHPRRGAFIAKISEGGRYVRAQNKNPVRAIEMLAERVREEAWRTCQARPWKRDA